MVRLVGQHRRLRISRSIKKQEVFDTVSEIFPSVSLCLIDGDYYLNAVSTYKYKDVGVRGCMIYTDSDEYKYYRIPCEKESYLLRYSGNNFILVNCKTHWIEICISRLTKWVTDNNNIVELGK